MIIPPYARYDKTKKIVDGKWVTGEAFGDLRSETNWLVDEEGITFLIAHTTFIPLEDKK